MDGIIPTVMKRMDTLTDAQNRTAVATLAAAIVQTRNATDVVAIIEALKDAEHIINPNHGTSPYTEWRKDNGLDSF